MKKVLNLQKWLKSQDGIVPKDFNVGQSYVLTRAQQIEGNQIDLKSQHRDVDKMLQHKKNLIRPISPRMNSDKKYEVIAGESLDLLHSWVKKYKICTKDPEKSYSPKNISQHPKGQPFNFSESHDIFKMEQIPSTGMIPQFKIPTKNQGGQSSQAEDSHLYTLSLSQMVSSQSQGMSSTNKLHRGSVDRSLMFMESSKQSDHSLKNAQDLDISTTFIIKPQFLNDKIALDKTPPKKPQLISRHLPLPIVPRERSLPKKAARQLYTSLVHIDNQISKHNSLTELANQNNDVRSGRQEYNSQSMSRSSSFYNFQNMKKRIINGQTSTIALRKSSIHAESSEDYYKDNAAHNSGSPCRQLRLMKKGSSSQRHLPSAKKNKIMCDSPKIIEVQAPKIIQQPKIILKQYQANASSQQSFRSKPRRQSAAANLSQQNPVELEKIRRYYKKLDLHERSKQSNNSKGLLNKPKQKARELSWGCNSSTESNSPEATTKHCMSKNLTFKRKQSPYEKFDHKRLSNYKNELKSLYKELNSKSSSMAGSNSTMRINKQSKANQRRQAPVKAVHNIENEGPSPTYVEINFKNKRVKKPISHLRPQNVLNLKVINKNR